MLTKYSSQDAERLQQARLARFCSFIITDFKITIDGSCLILTGCDPHDAIRETNILLFQAFIILGTSRLEIRDADTRLLFTAELESEQIAKNAVLGSPQEERFFKTAQSGEDMTELATTERRVELDLTPTTTMPITVQWSRIANITGETEEELRSRLQTLGTAFYWDDDSWAVPHEIASQLVIRFRFEQGQREAQAMLTGVETEQPTQHSNGRKPQSKTEKPQKLEFQPLKRGVMPTLEKYLAFISNDETTQMDILDHIVKENVKGKRHLTKIIDSYTNSPELDKPQKWQFQVAAKNLMDKRAKGATVTGSESVPESPSVSNDSATAETEAE
ncbi:MAG: hypothetical protein V7K14_03560 [Nostoc sp.]|uniref:hypothetical protein n=1 Tax=Nostoc sp. TaxID=1180 RepID=UPI002FF8CFDE